MATLTKPQMLRALAEPPDGATVEEAIERLLFLSQVEEGLTDVRAGRSIPHGDIVRAFEPRAAGRSHARG